MIIQPPDLDLHTVAPSLAATALRFSFAHLCNRLRDI
jgi:hypothetical protein